jgi:SAM-dependent methyltransferase
MTPHDAIALIDHPLLRSPTPTHWADLGCGTGTFTLALAHLLSPGSIIEAIDRHPGIARQTTTGGVTIIPRTADFVTSKVGLSDLDGILMANSLHYVQDKPALLQKLRASYRAAGQGAPLNYVPASHGARIDNVAASPGARPNYAASSLGAILLVEYDTDQPTPHWVPYPLSFAAAAELLPAAGWPQVQKLASRPSAFGHSELYVMLGR